MASKKHLFKNYFKKTTKSPLHCLLSDVRVFGEYGRREKLNRSRRENDYTSTTQCFVPRKTMHTSQVTSPASVVMTTARRWEPRRRWVATHGLIGYREKELPATKGGMRRFYEQQQFI